MLIERSEYITRCSFYADYEYCIFSVEKLNFGTITEVLNYSKIGEEIYHSMQNFILYKITYLMSTFVAKNTF